MFNNKKKIVFTVCSIIMILFSVYLGPVDGFKHGFYIEEINTDLIAGQDWYDTIDLSQGYQMSFSPVKKNFAGIVLFLRKQLNDNCGTLILKIKDDDGEVIEKQVVDLASVKDASWYNVYFKIKLKEGRKYILDFSINGCANAPYLQRVDKEYLPNETLDSDVLISYAYSKSTFSFQNKIIFLIFMLSIWLFLLTWILTSSKKKQCLFVAKAIFITAILTWNYMYNSMDNLNDRFKRFQEDSETLVTGVIYAEWDGIYFKNEDEKGYGLGRYSNLRGELITYDTDYRTDENWLDGFSLKEPAINVNANLYSRSVAVVGNSILFHNGEAYQITSVTDNDPDIVIHLSSDKILTSAKCGSLDDVVFLDKNGTKIQKGAIWAYRSQYGLQGKLFRHLARYMSHDEALSTLNLICSLTTALVFVIIVLMLYKKYNKIMAGCFLVTFWLSPWVINFARNLYWVEFTWFIPMMVGLFCAWKINNKKCRIVSYFLAAIAILVKCLCGYEYISVIMMGLISFLLIDLVLSFINKDKEKTILIFRTTVIIGVLALVGFMVAICIHALLKGEGQILTGIKRIFEQDVLRRTNGGNLNDFDPNLWPSMNASIWEVVCMYFHFSTEIIQGITGNMFSLLVYYSIMYICLGF